MGARNEKAVAFNKKNKTSCDKMGVFNVSNVGLTKKTIANYIKNQ